MAPMYDIEDTTISMDFQFGQHRAGFLTINNLLNQRVLDSAMRLRHS
jgi:hypothetical protein